MTFRPWGLPKAVYVCLEASKFVFGDEIVQTQRDQFDFVDLRVFLKFERL